MRKKSSRIGWPSRRRRKPALQEELGSPLPCPGRSRVGIARSGKGQPPQRDEGFDHRGGPGLRPLVAVPAAVRPLPALQALGQLPGALVVDAQSDGIPDGIALLGGAAPKAILLSRQQQGLAELQVRSVQQPVVHLFAQRQQLGVARRVVDQGQAVERPVGALPFAVGAGDGTVRLPAGEQAAGAVRVRNGRAQPAQPRRVLGLLQQQEARLVLQGRVPAFQELPDHRQLRQSCSSHRVAPMLHYPTPGTDPDQARGLKPAASSAAGPSCGS